MAMLAGAAPTLKNRIDDHDTMPFERQAAGQARAGYSPTDDQHRHGLSPRQETPPQGRPQRRGHHFTLAPETRGFGDDKTRIGQRFSHTRGATPADRKSTRLNSSP